MKIVPNATFTVDDIRETLALADWKLPKMGTLPNGLTVRFLKEGAVTHLFLCSDVNKKFVGCASLQKDKIPTLMPAVKGVRVFQTGLLKQYRGIGVMYRLLNMINKKYRVFASPAMTKQGMLMWYKRIKMDRDHAYFLYKPSGHPYAIQEQDEDDKQQQDDFQPFLRVTRFTVDEMKNKIWDGSLKTRLIMLQPNDPVVKRYDHWKRL